MQLWSYSITTCSIPHPIIVRIRGWNTCPIRSQSCQHGYCGVEGEGSIVTEILLSRVFSVYPGSLVVGWRELMEFVSRSWVELLQDRLHSSRSDSYIGKTKYVTENRDIGPIFWGYFVRILALETGCDDSSKLLLRVFEKNAKTIVFQGMLSPNICAL